MKSNNIAVRKWLINNNYQDVAQLINNVMDIWKLKSVCTRRNWWDVLAGKRDGSFYVIEGIQFPIIKAAQLRKGYPVSDNAISRDENELIPNIWINGRWTKIEIDSSG